MSGSPIEQLHYTWARRGVEGVNRFQIAAISPGLTKAPLASLVPVLRKVCQYDRGSAIRPTPSATLAEQQDPISFGWFDHRNVRVAFCRRSLPLLRGKVGNFAAHLLVGEPTAMAEGDLAQLFESSMWWTPAPEVDAQSSESSACLQLLPLDLAEWTGGDSVEGSEPLEAVEALADSLLRLKPKARLAVLGDSWRFGRVLRMIGRICPEALTGISLSTFEATPPFPFRVIGSPTPRAGYESFALHDRHVVDSQFHETFTRLSEGGAEGALLARAAGAAVAELAGDNRRERYRLTAEQIAGAANGRVDQIGLSQIAPLPGAIEYVASTADGQEAIAESLIAGDARVSIALRQADATVARRDVSNIFDLVVNKYLEGRSLRGCGPTISLLRDLVGDTETNQSATVLRTALEGSRAETLGSGDVAVLLLVAAQQRVDVAALAPLIRRAAIRADLFLRDERLPADYLFAVFRNALTEKPLRSDVLALFVSEHPAELSSPELTNSEIEGLVEVLETLGTDDLVRALAECVAIVGRASSVDRVAALLTRIDSRDAVRLLVASATESREGSLIVLARGYAAELLAHDIGANVAVIGRSALARAMQLLQAIDDPDCRQALSVLAVLGGKDFPEVLRAASGVAAISDVGLRSAVERCALPVAVASIRSRADARDVWELLFRTRFGIAEALTQVLRAAASSPLSASHVLGWLAADLLPSHTEYVRREGFLRDAYRAALVAELAQRAEPRQLQQYEDDVAGGVRSVRLWWRDITSMSEPRHGLRGRLRLSRSPSAADGEGAVPVAPKPQPEEGAGT